MTTYSVARRKRGVNRLQLEASLAEILFADTEIALAQSRIGQLVTPRCMDWLTNQIENTTMGLYPGQKLDHWLALERELENETTCDEYETLAAGPFKGINGGSVEMTDAPVCVMKVAG